MKKIFLYFIDAIKNFKKYFVICISYIILLTIINIFFPYSIRVFINEVIESNDFRLLIYGVIFYVVFLMLRVFIKILYNVALDDFGGNYINNVNKKCIIRLSSTSLTNIENISYNKLKNILFSDILEIFRVIGNYLPNIFSSLLVVLFSLALSFFYEWKISIIILISLLIGVILSFFSRKIIRKSSKKTNNKLKDYNSQCNEFIDSISIVQTNNILDLFTNKSSESIKSFIDVAKKEDKKVYLWSGIIESFNLFFNLFLSTLLSLPFIDGNIVNFVFFTTLSSLIMEQGQKIENIFQSIIRSTPSFDHVDEILNLPIRQGSHKLNQINQISFENVSFYYNNDNIIFNDINCMFVKNDIIRLIGSNGSGKSTFLKLLLGLYNNQEGAIKINSCSIKLYSQSDLNEKILFLTSDEILLNISVLDYIKSMCLNASIEDIQNGFKKLNIDFQNKIIENNGLNLSLGQRKKILLLKLLLMWKNKEVIILDEISSGLDLETKSLYEEIVNQIIENGSKIIIIVEHVWTFNIPINKVLEIKDKKIEIKYEI